MFECGCITPKYVSMSISLLSQAVQTVLSGKQKNATPRAPYLVTGPPGTHVGEQSAVTMFA